MKHTLLSILILFFAIDIYSQQLYYEICGSVKSENKESILNATVLLMNGKDSSISKVAITNDAGNFSFSINKTGVYWIEITSVGYEKCVSDKVEISDKHKSVSIPDIILKASERTVLKSVVITSKKPLVEQQIDRTVINISSLISSAGSNALELVAKAPGIAISANNMVSLNGKDGVLIYIDDKPTYLSGTDLISYLKSLPGSQIDKIEIMTNPPAKYEASGNTGIINIKTKKSKVKGFNGNFSTSYEQGVYARASENLNLNYRNNKANFWGSFGYSSIRDYIKSSINRLYFNEDFSPNYEARLNGFDKQKTSIVNFKIGADYYLSDKTTLGTNLSGVTRPNSETRNTETRMSSHGELDSAINADMVGDYHWKNGNVNLNLQQVMRRSGEVLTVDLDRIFYRSGGSQYFVNKIYDSDGNKTSGDILLGNLPGKIDIYSGKADYVYPVKQKAKIEGGVKSSLVRTNFTAEYFAGVNESSLEPDYGKTNNFIYKENVNSAYINYYQDFGKLALQSGLRLENTVLNGDQLGNANRADSNFSRRYTDLFPTIYISYKLDSLSNNMFIVSYGRRINRPSYYDLNPFFFFRDKYSYHIGNPYLKPEYANNIELSYKYKSSFNLSVIYNGFRGQIIETLEQIGNSYVSRNENIGKSDVIGILANSNISPLKRWSCNIQAEYLFHKYATTLNPVESLAASIGTWNASILNQFKFNNKWSAELYGSYTSKSLLGQVVRSPYGQLDVSVQKLIFNQKGSIRLNVKDVFKSTGEKGRITNVERALINYVNGYDSRSIGLTFTYRFGKGTDGTKQNRKTGGAESEQRRAGGL